MQNDLVLRDIHLSAAPSWWPPAPGWWIVAGMVAAAALLGFWLAARRRRRRVAIARLFDDAVANAATPAAKAARISELLRRAAIRRDPSAGQLEGEAWLRLLDAGSKSPIFAADAARTLLEGGYRADTTQAQVDALHQAARDRFLQWMSAKR